MKVRLDNFLIENGYFKDIKEAQAAIMSGLVYVNGQISDKPGNLINPDLPLNVKGKECPYVSRGGYKLEKALDSFSINLTGLNCLDIGSSTGGFTDCMLLRGANSVCAVDVGTNQLAYKLRTDERVDVKEQYNFRYAEPKDFNGPYDFACTDVSFISLNLIFPPAAKLLKENSYMVALIKPQFEAEKNQVENNGIIKDTKVHKQVIEKVIKYAQNAGFRPCKLDYSPIRGAKGNIEFLILIQKSKNTDISEDINIDEVLKAVHKEETK